MTPFNTCVHCGNPFTLRRSPSGSVEAMARFKRRLHCSRSCARYAQADREYAERERVEMARLFDVMPGSVVDG